MVNKTKSGFALPTVLIASIVMLMVLTVAVSATSSTRAALQSQYYEQLAHAAGDAGVAYARACLAANGNTPLWTNAKPLMPNTDCSGNVTTTCPDGVTTFFTNTTPAICSVTLKNNVRSSFSVGLPTLDSNNDATTIPNSGFVQLLRASTGAVVRTYNQQSTQAAAVPALCSGAASSIYGWNDAVVTTAPYSLSDSTALPISISNTGLVYTGPKYFRKDFNVTTAGTYTLTTASRDMVSWYLDGTSLLVSNFQNTTPMTTSFSLGVGCHTFTVKAINTGILPDPSDFEGSLKLNGASLPLVVTDTSWRVTAGSFVHYSSSKYYVDTNSWTNVYGVRTSASGDANWTASSGDSTSTFIASPNSNSGGNYPGAQWTDFRDSRDVTVASNTDVKVTVQCDDNCIVYMDGNAIISSAAWSADYSTTITLTTGTHHFGVAVYNAGVGASGFSMSVVSVSSGSILTHSDTSWVGANYWNATDPNPYSYDNTFNPSPNQVPSATVQVLVVAGGGGGGEGGGGAGGVISQSGVSVSPQLYPVVVGSGGAGSSNGAAAGSNGSNSSIFGIIAIGGGAGGVSSAGNLNGAAGGSGGGGRRDNGGTFGGGVTGQGNVGGTGIAGGFVWQGGGGGGGAGAVGGNGSGNSNASAEVAGKGGAGIVSSISGNAVTYGGGGGGSTEGTGGNVSQRGTGGAGGGGAGFTAQGGASLLAVAGTANTGGGGGGRCTNSPCTGTAGAGGSGIVIISYPTGSMTTTGGTVTTSGGNTIVTFTSSGTFTVVSIP